MWIDLEQVASFVNGLPRFIGLGKIQIDGLVADVAERQIRHMGGHGEAPIRSLRLGEVGCLPGGALSHFDTF